MQQETYAVIGSLFGDEGKGHTVQWLCKEAIRRGKNPIVVRFSGGSQAGHTVSDGRMKHICSSYGSGVMENVPTLIYDSGGSCSAYNHAYFDPIAACNEFYALRQEYMKAYPDRVFEFEAPKLYVSSGVRIITPYDMYSDRQDKKLLSDGTCGSGQWATHKRYEDNVNFKTSNPKDYLYQVYRYYTEQGNVYANDECEKFEEAFLDSIAALPFETVRDVKSLVSEYDVVIMEGSQGLLLDADKGFYPHVTSTSVGVSATFDFIKNVLNTEPSQCEYFFVTRTYMTRHGNGYRPLSFDDSEVEKHFRDEENETNQTNRFQGVFKVGKYDTEMLHTAFQRHTLDNLQEKYNLRFNLAITHFDKLAPSKYLNAVIGDSSEEWNLEKYLAKVVESTGVNIVKVYTASSPYADFTLRLDFQAENTKLS
ncbi:MAG: adenylosuccinate synthetase [Bacteroidales bacterium]|nr:adenylosuccinate synthetase [Bacteroidales bacterium]